MTDVLEGVTGGATAVASQTVANLLQPARLLVISGSVLGAPVVGSLVNSGLQKVLPPVSSTNPAGNGTLAAYLLAYTAADVAIINATYAYTADPAATSVVAVMIFSTQDPYIAALKQALQKLGISAPNLQ